MIGGFISSLVKWGSEVNMPPRMPGEISPPGANIDAWLGWSGFNQHSLDYMFQGNSILGAVTLYHWLFSFVFAFVYVAGSIYWDKMRLWYGALYGILITIIMHGFLILLFGFRYPKYAGGLNGWIWNLNAAELYRAQYMRSSETFLRRDFRRPFAFNPVIYQKQIKNAVSICRLGGYGRRVLQLIYPSY